MNGFSLGSPILKGDMFSCSVLRASIFWSLCSTQGVTNVLENEASVQVY